MRKLKEKSLSKTLYQTNHPCEVCGRDWLPVIMDCQIYEGPLGPKGHWVYLCPAHHYILGISSRSESLTIYRRFIAKYFEYRGEYRLSAEDLNDLIGFLKKDALKDKEADILLLGQIALQLNYLTEAVKAQGDFFRLLMLKLFPEPKPFEVPEPPMVSIDRGEDNER